MRARYLLWALLISGCRCAEDKDEVIDCESCVADGEECDVSYNCQADSICNIELEGEFFDPNQPLNICRQVDCDSDEECDFPKICALSGHCMLPACQSDVECTNARCLDGNCVTPPQPTDRMRCEIVTLHQALLPGASVVLEAVVVDEAHRVYAGLELTWSSSDPAVAEVSQNMLLAVAPGRATISAKLAAAPQVECAGPTVTVFEQVSAGTVRVVARDERTGAPVRDAAVTLQTATTVLTASTGADGEALFATNENVYWVTALKDGWRSLTVFEPGVFDLYLPMQRAHDVTLAGGIRGSTYSPSSFTRGDIGAVLVSSARPLNLFEHRALPIVDIVPTLLNAPEIGLDNNLAPLGGNLAIKFGDNVFTEDETRCRGDVPAAEHLGCYLTRVPEGRSAVSVMGGGFQLSQIADVAGTGFSSEEEGSFTAKDRARLMLLLHPLTQSMSFGARPYLEIEAFPRLPDRENVDCTDPMQLHDCTADYDQYQQIDTSATVEPNIMTVVSVPHLPELPDRRCAGLMTVSRYAVLPARGLVLTGLATVQDIEERDPPDCEVAGQREPFGRFSEDLIQGQVGLRSAPLHSGMEGSRQVTIIAAVDIEPGETRSLDLNLMIDHTQQLGTTLDLSSNIFLEYPTGLVRREDGTFEIVNKGGPRSTGMRLALESARGSWTIYVPGTDGQMILPNIALPREVLAETELGALQAFAADHSYTSMWSLGSDTRADRLLENVSAIATSQCSTSSPCWLTE